MIIVTLILLGLCLGSFVNALVWRIHEQSKPKAKQKAPAEDLSISKGRSMCTHCGHTLSVKDLLPVISWLSLNGRCRYCKKSISWQYPLVELLTAVLFVALYIFWPDQLLGWEIVKFGAWLLALTGLIALTVYDLRWMLLPNRIVFPLFSVSAAVILSEVAKESSVRPFGEAVLSILIGGGIFYALFRISNEKWIGGGDVKLGFLLGALLINPLHTGLMLFIASLLGTLISLPLLLSGKAGKNTRIPFGPFLIAGAVISLLFGSAILDWYLNQAITL